MVTVKIFGMVHVSEKQTSLNFHETIWVPGTRYAWIFGNSYLTLEIEQKSVIPN